MEGPTISMELNASCIWELLNGASKELADELRMIIDHQDQFSAATIRRVLSEVSPAAFEYVAAVQEALTDANDLISGGVSRLTRVAKLAIAEEKKRRELSVSEKKGNTGKKRSREGLSANPEESSVMDHTIVDSYYTKKDMWTDLYNVSHFAIPGSRIPAEGLISRYETYKTIYHCTSKWAMESLCEKLQTMGYEALCLRDTNVKYDLDMLRWKVITSQPYEIEV